MPPSRCRRCRQREGGIFHKGYGHGYEGRHGKACRQVGRWTCGQRSGKETGRMSGSSGETGWWTRKRNERGRRALERQLDYQEKKARDLAEGADELARTVFLRSQIIRQRLNAIRPIARDDRVLEVGSGAHGLVFGFGENLGVGVDPLAVDYKRLFPKLQQNAVTVAAIGEMLPFEDGAFDIVLSDRSEEHTSE